MPSTRHTEHPEDGNECAVREGRGGGVTVVSMGVGGITASQMATNFSFKYILIYKPKCRTCMHALLL